MRGGVLQSAWLACAVGCAVLATPAGAHREPASLTSIDYNAQSGNTEIVHRLHRHDAEVGIGATLDEHGLTMSKLRARAQAALYVEERFAIVADGRDVPLELIGAELTGDYLLVYQEYRGKLPPHIRIRNDVLRDAFSEQANTINISDGDAVHTLLFVGDTSWQAFTFEQENARTAAAE